MVFQYNVRVNWDCLALLSNQNLNIMCEDHVIALRDHVGVTNFESCDDRVYLTLRHNRYKK